MEDAASKYARSMGWSKYSVLPLRICRLDQLAAYLQRTLGLAPLSRDGIVQLLCEWLIAEQVPQRLVKSVAAAKQVRVWGRCDEAGAAC